MKNAYGRAFPNAYYRMGYKEGYEGQEADAPNSMWAVNHAAYMDGWNDGRAKREKELTS